MRTLGREQKTQGCHTAVTCCNSVEGIQQRVYHISFFSEMTRMQQPIKPSLKKQCDTEGVLTQAPPLPCHNVSSTFGKTEGRVYHSPEN